jgi:DNA-binding IclR family transcriptional regulator
MLPPTPWMSGMAIQSPSPPVQGTQSVSRAVALLRAVARDNEKGARLSGLARNVGLNAVTARRLLSVLVHEGLLDFDPHKKTYTIGIALYHIGSAAKQFEIRDRFRGTLEKIADQTEDTVFLFIRRGNDAICIDRIEGRFPIRALLVDVGVSRPLGLGASGLALIAFLPPDEFQKVFSVNLKQYNSFPDLKPGTIMDLAKKSIKRGYVVSESLFWPGVTAVSVPVFDDQMDVIAAVSVTAISPRMTRNRQAEVARIIQNCLRQSDFRIYSKVSFNQKGKGG